MYCVLCNVSYIDTREHFYMYCILCSVTFITLIQGNILINTWEQFGVLIVLGGGACGARSKGPVGPQGRGP